MSLSSVLLYCCVDLHQCEVEQVFFLFFIFLNNDLLVVGSWRGEDSISTGSKESLL